MTAAAGDGEASLEQEGSQTRVRVRLTGTPGNTRHAGHVHEGATCASLGSAVAPLEPVTTDPQGTGEMTATVAMEPSRLMDDNHLVAYHEAGGKPGRPVVCGEIPPLP